MAVVTLFFCGTDSKSTDKASNDETYLNGELISRLGDRCSGTNERTKFTIDGPGSGNLQEKWKIRGRKNYWGPLGLIAGKGWDENVMYAIDTLLDRVNRKLISPSDLRSLSGKATTWMPDRDASKCAQCELKFGLLGRGKHHCRLCGRIFCETCTKNRLSIKDPLSPSGSLPGNQDEQRVCDSCFKVWFPEYHKKADEDWANKIDRINCIGWSRGGVTTHMFANACKDEPLLRAKEIRLITVDPVPGGSEMSQHRVRIDNPNLKEYVVFFARDERSRAFAPVRVDTGQNCKRTTYWFPGNHSTLVGRWGRNRTFYKSAVLVRHIAETHLQDWGTRFDKTMQLTDNDVLQYYDEMVAHRGDFEKLHKKAIIGVKGHGFTQYKGRDMMVDPRTAASKGIMPSNPFSNAVFIKAQKLDPYAKTSSGGVSSVDDCFVNWHHKELLRKRVPNVVEFIEGAKSQPLFDRVHHEIAVLKHQLLCYNVGWRVESQLNLAEAEQTQRYRLQNRFAVGP